MATRAVVAEPFGDGWRGRHTHWDGYPTGRGKCLWQLVQRDGVEKVRRTIIQDNYGWSSITGEARPKKDDNSTRFKVVRGYGVAYTTTPQAMYNGGAQCSPEDWITQSDSTDTEWCYVLADTAMWVYAATYPTWGSDPDYYRKPPTWQPCGVFAWDGDEPDWRECELSILTPEERAEVDEAASA